MSDPRTGGYADPTLPIHERVADLVSRLTLPEKVALLHQHQPGVARLGVSPFRTGTEALHGLAWLGAATVFPQAVGLGASWDPELVRRVGAAVGDEVRGSHHKDPSQAGLNVWAPVVNPLRDPRWGRNEEGYSEDAWLTGVLGAAYARGLRGDHPTYLRTAPTLKHFLGYNNETDRCNTSSQLPPRVLHEYELRAYEQALRSGAAVAVMASYNLVNGRPAHLSPLIKEVLRGWSADEVMVVGDAGAGVNIAGAQGYHPDHVAGFAAALRAGVDCFTEDDADSAPTVDRLTRALEQGMIGESDVDAAVRHILSVRFRLGEFDPAERNPYAAVTEDVINCPAHQELARAAARAALVLLKNDGTVLPLAADSGARVAVVGPLADVVLEDWYSGTQPYMVTARDGIAERVGAGNVRHAEGVDRIAIRVAGTGRYVVADDSPGGGPLHCGGSNVTPYAWIDVFDWGAGVFALRTAANQRHVGTDPDGALVNDQPGPNGWVVKETFRLVDRDDGTVAIYHLAGQAYVSVGADGVLRADAEDLDAATGFTVDLVVDGARAAAAAAAESDVAVVVVGNHPMVNGRETEDRPDLALPAAQEALIRAVYAANPRTVLVIASSYPYAIGWADAHLPAILWSAHGGQEYGHALADVLFGDADPTGRLPQTWYADTADLPDLLDYDIIGTDATYLYFRGTPLYPFGHGLSYTTFAYHDLRLSAEAVDPDDEVSVLVDVVNTGDRPGEEVVQLYTRQRRSRVKQPLRALRGFARIRLAPGERTTVHLALRAADLAFWDVTRGRSVVEHARHTVAVGRSSTDLLATATLQVRGERIPPRDPAAGPLRAVDFDEYAGVALVPEEPDRGEAVQAQHASAWLAFGDVDFGAGVPLMTARVSLRSPVASTTTASRSAAAPAPATALVTLRLDDPLDGPVAGAVAVPSGGGWADVPAQLSGAHGVRDVFLVLEAPGVTVGELTFVAEVGAV